jgi:hypothetical protein
LQQQGFEALPREGEKSQFDVVRDGELVFSKQAEHRYPTVDEVLERLRA